MILKKFNLDYYSTLFILIPVIVLLEGLFKSPFYSVDLDVNSSTFPVLLILLFSINLFNLKLYNHHLTNFYIILILLSFLISFNLSVERIGVFINFLISIILTLYVLSKKNFPQIIFYFVLVFSLLSFAIYFYRLFTYDFNFIRVRSGANIFGGNTLFLVQVMYLSIDKFFNNKNSKNHNIIFFLTFLNSLLFINRLALVLIPILFLFIYGFKKTFYSIVLVIIFFIYNSAKILNFDLYNSILMRFSSSNPFLTREQLLIDAMNLLYEYPIFGTGIGMFKFYSTQTSAHNLFLNIFAEMGIILGFFIVLILLFPLYKLLMKKRFKSLFYYMSFLLVSIVAGEKLIQFTGYVSSFNSIMIISVLVIINNEKYFRRFFSIKPR